MIKKRQIFSFGLLLYDFIAIYFAYFMALYLTFGCEFKDIAPTCLESYFQSMPYYIGMCVLIYWVFKLYNSLWRLVSYYELFSFTFAIAYCVLIYSIVCVILFPDIPLRYYIIGGWLQIWLALLSRFAYRFLFFTSLKMQKNNSINSRGMLIGAGSAGGIILRDIIANRNTNINICCIIDDDIDKKNCHLNGVPIVGNRDEILLNVKKYNIEEIFFAIPSATAENKRIILNICHESGCKLKTLPSVYQLVTGEVSLQKMKDVSIEDLLGRDTIKVNTNEILKNLRDKVILVTGGGGSIGSELCRQIASSEPKQLIIFDVYENNAYDIEQELKRTCPNLNLLTLIGSVRDPKRLRHIFKECKPQIVFHAAAHKHVPLMERSPYESIKNNVLGTYKTAYMSLFYGAERFVLISTDKAVNPTNIMGASKRLCEMIIQTMNKISASGNYDKLLSSFSCHGDRELFGDKSLINNKHKTEFVAVRFGNVLGSNGSVIPLFKKQIAAGGPVLVTHPDIIRYFMTIPEAVSLVLQASAYAKGGEIFVLDMGSPIKIDTLARNLIKLSGLKVDEDIKIQYSGLRPGEKLYEEKLMAEEGLMTTENDLIHIAQPIAIDIDKFMKDLEDIACIALDNEGDIHGVIAKVVTTFKRMEN